VHDERIGRAALELARAGANATDISRRLHVPRRTVSDWIGGCWPHSVRPGKCQECAGTHDFAALSRSYAYLPGLYLGDGCISRHPRAVSKLRVFLDVKYPGIIAAAVDAMAQVKGGRAAIVPRPQNCVEVYSFWKCWPCMFPQHGAGRKHERTIELADWQDARS
jgi:hypothetical protein